MSTFKNKNSLRTTEAQISKKVKNNEARPKFTGSYKKKSVYTIRDCRTALSSDVCTIGIIRTNVYPASFNKREINRLKTETAEQGQGEGDGGHVPPNIFKNIKS